MGLLEVGALQMLPASTSLLTHTPGPAAAAVIWTTTSLQQVKQAKGKQDFEYPRKRKGISAVHLNILCLFSNIRNYRQVG